MNSTKKPKLKLSNAARKRNSTTFQIFSKLRQYLNLCFVYIEADIFHGVGQFISRDKTVSVLNTRYQQQLPIQTFPKWYLTMSKTLNASRMSSSTHRSSYFLRMFADVYELPAKCKETMINFLLALMFYAHQSADDSFVQIWKDFVIVPILLS